VADKEKLSKDHTVLVVTLILTALLTQIGDVLKLDVLGRSVSCQVSEVELGR